MIISPLITKLNIKPGTFILMINAQSEVFDLLDSLPENCVMDSDKAMNTNYDLILLFVYTKEELFLEFSELLPDHTDHQRIWICYPKKTSGLNTNITRGEIWATFKPFSFRPVSQTSINTTWSAIRVRRTSQVSQKKKVQVPEIDYNKRVVYPPGDLKEALIRNELSDRFNNLTFTHKKEQVEAIIKAKKPETRTRRILTTIETLKK